MHQEIDKEPRMMTTAEVAKYLRVSRATVYRLVKQGEIPVSRIAKHLRFRRDVIDRWLSEKEAMNSYANEKWLRFLNADFGEEFFTALAENSPQIQTSTEMTQRIASGELDMGITIDFTVRKLLKGNPGAPIDYIYPEAGVVMVPSPIAIFKDSQNIEVAKVFERYILSKRGQAVLRDLGGFVPVRLDVSPPEGITSITQLRVIPSDKRWITEHRDDIVSKFIDIFGQRKD